MKVRSDFVTNSSSTSYMIAYKDFGTQNKEPILNCMDELVKGIFGQSYGYEGYCHGVFENLQDFREHWFNEYYYPTYKVGEDLDQLAAIAEEKTNAKCEIAKPYFEDGYNVICREVGYHEDAANALLEALDSSYKEHFVIVDGKDYENDETEE